MKFRLCNPTDIRFGEGQIAALSELVPERSRLLVLYGGGSIKKNGVYEKVMKALEGREIMEFGGVESNPLYETLRKASTLGREKGVDFVLGVGGGSVVDAAKFLSAMIGSGLDDPWDHFFDHYIDVVPIPNGCVLTLPATGSESNPVAVISSSERTLKYPFESPAVRPVFAIMDPTTMQSLSRTQLQNGVVDSFTHVLEQYLTAPVNAPIQHGFSETLLRVLIEWGPVLVETKSPKACENIMWAANQALNGLIGAGVPQDWSTHMIGHAITALHGVEHARSLTMVMPSLLRYKLDSKHTMLTRYGRNVFNIMNLSDRETALQAIEKTEEFMVRMDCPIRISQSVDDFDPDSLIHHLEEVGHTKLGENGDIGPAQVREILLQAH